VTRAQDDAPASIERGGRR